MSFKDLWTTRNERKILFGEVFGRVGFQNIKTRITSQEKVTLTLLVKVAIISSIFGQAYNFSQARKFCNQFFKPGFYFFNSELLNLFLTSILNFFPFCPIKNL